MKTTVYIDGFNLYYGALSNTNYKWLDVVKLFTQICHQQDPNTEIISIKFFTSPVKGSIANRGQDAEQSQKSYIKGLKTLYPDNFECIEGGFSMQKGKAPIYQEPIIKGDKVDIWKLEEKKTDVNIALNMYIDAQKGIEQVVLVSNDTDLVPAFEAIKREYPNVQIATVLPRMKITGKKRPLNRDLAALSNWKREYITEDELKNAQLPDYIPTNKKPAYKPKYW